MSARGRRPACRGRCCPICSRPEAPVVFRPVARPGAVALDPALARRVRRSNATAATAPACSGSRSTARRSCARCARSYALDYEQATGYLQLFRTEAGSRGSAATRTMLGRTGRAPRAARAPAQCRALEPALHPATAARGRTAPARRRDRQLRVLRAPAQGHRRARRRGVPLRRRRCRLRAWRSGRIACAAHVGRPGAGRCLRHRRRRSTAWPLLRADRHPPAA